MATFVRTQEIEQDIGPRGRLAIRVTSPDVDLRAVEGGTARVSVQFELRAETDADADDLFERIKFHVHQGEGSLEVTEPKAGGSGIDTIARLLGMGSGRVDVAVAVEAPAGAELVFEGVGADVTATGFTGTQAYRTVSGDLVLQGLGGEVNIRGVSSDVSLRADSPLRLELNTVSGDVSAFAPRFDDLRMVTVSGDVEIEGTLAPAGGHRIETVSGDLSLGTHGGLTLEVRGLSTDVDVSLPHRSEGSRDRRRYVIGGGETSLIFSSMSGDVSVRPSRRGGMPTPPTPPTAPTPPTPASLPTPPTPPTPPMSDDAQLDILRALERGEIDIEEAAARLAGRSPDA